MSISIKNPNSLKPRLLGRNSSQATRVEGVLVRDGCADHVLVGEIDFDGTRCRYRSLQNTQDGTQASAQAGTQNWHTEQDGDDSQALQRRIPVATSNRQVRPGSIPTRTLSPDFRSLCPSTRNRNSSPRSVDQTWVSDPMGSTTSTSTST